MDVEDYDEEILEMAKKIATQLMSEKLKKEKALNAQNYEPEEELLDVDELSARLKIKKSWIYAKTKLRGGDNLIPCLRMGRYCRFRLSEVIAWLEKNTIERNEDY